jgi:hypothetical protein
VSGELKFRNEFLCEQRMALEVKRQLTPSRRVRVINGWVDVTKIDFAHETINLNKVGNEDEEQDLRR